MMTLPLRRVELHINKLGLESSLLFSSPRCVILLYYLSYNAIQNDFTQAVIRDYLFLSWSFAWFIHDYIVV